MDSKQKRDAYRMPMKQLLKLLETTADDSTHTRRTSRPEATHQIDHEIDRPPTRR